jgi:alanine dehydrogenase
MGTKHEKVMIGVFHTAGEARRAIEGLRDEGFSDKKVGVLTHDKDGDPEVKSFRDLEGNKAGTGAAIGATAGAGGGALWALGIAAGVLPAIGPVIAGGLLAAIAASAASGAAAGVVVGSLVGLGISDEEAAYYDEEFRKGRTIVVVQTDDKADVAYRILSGHNSQNPHMLPPDAVRGGTSVDTRY